MAGNVELPSAFPDRYYSVCIHPDERFFAPERTFATQERPDILPVIDAIIRQSAAGQANESREDVEGDRWGVQYCTRWYLAGPPGDKGHANAALLGASDSPAQTACIAAGVRMVLVKVRARATIKKNRPTTFSE